MEISDGYWKLRGYEERDYPEKITKKSSKKFWFKVDLEKANNAALKSLKELVRKQSPSQYMIVLHDLHQKKKIVSGTYNLPLYDVAFKK